MKVLKIDKKQLSNAILTRAHAAASWDEYPYLVALNPEDDEPITARVIWADTSSSDGGYFTNFVGEENHRLEDFVSREEDYEWSEDEDDYDDPGPEEAAQDWIEENLLRHVELGDVTYKVEYTL